MKNFILHKYSFIIIIERLLNKYFINCRQKYREYCTIYYNYILFDGNCTYQYLFVYVL